MFGRVTANFAVLIKNYYMHNKMPPFMNEYLVLLRKQNPAATQCCMQLSHALNAAGLTIPKVVKPGHRIGDNPVIPGANGHYLLAVDEVQDFLTVRGGRTDVFDEAAAAWRRSSSRPSAGKASWPSAIRGSGTPPNCEPAGKSIRAPSRAT